MYHYLGKSYTPEETSNIVVKMVKVDGWEFKMDHSGGGAIGRATSNQKVVMSGWWIHPEKLPWRAASAKEFYYGAIVANALYNQD